MRTNLLVDSSLKDMDGSEDTKDNGRCDSRGKLRIVVVVRGAGMERDMAIRTGLDILAILVFFIVPVAPVLIIRPVVAAQQAPG
jgi:hypothetical protein